MMSAHGERNVRSEQEGLTIVLFGKTGNGKSSVGNIILGEGQGLGDDARGHFPVSSGMASATVNTERCTTKRNGISIEVIDIPDFTNLYGSIDVIKRDIRSVKTEVANKRYVILLAVRCDVRYTKEEYDIYKEFRDLWGRDISDHLIVAFTFVDRQERDLGKELETVNPELKSVLKDAGWRYVLCDDMTDGNDKERQAERLIATIMELQRKVGPVTRQSQRVSDDGVHYGSMSHDHNRHTLTREQDDNCCRRALYIVCSCCCFACCDCCDDCCCDFCNDFRYLFKDYKPC